VKRVLPWNWFAVAWMIWIWTIERPVPKDPSKTVLLAVRQAVTQWIWVSVEAVMSAKETAAIPSRKPAELSHLVISQRVASSKSMKPELSTKWDA